MPVTAPGSGTTQNQAVPGPEDIWNALRSAGATATEAIGIMANMIAESSLNVESQNADPAPGDPAARAYGLVSWNTATYPNASGLVTGNPWADLQNQVNFLASEGAFRLASGSTPQEAAGNFAANYERCQGCNPGSTYQNGWSTRVGNAATVSQWVQSGSWPAGTQQAADAAAVESATTGSGSTCAWQVSLGFLHGCVLSKTQVRAFIGGGLLIGGVLITQVGMAAVAIAATIRVGETLLGAVPGVGRGVGLVRKVAGGSAATAAAAAPARTGNPRPPAREGREPGPARRRSGRTPPPPSEVRPNVEPSAREGTSQPRRGGRTQQGSQPVTA